jgi:hypothetical protein
MKELLQSLDQIGEWGKKERERERERERARERKRERKRESEGGLHKVDVSASRQAERLRTSFLHLNDISKTSLGPKMRVYTSCPRCRVTVIVTFQH